jgi:fumarylacetoacetate (FAA) hydrolase
MSFGTAMTTETSRSPTIRVASLRAGGRDGTLVVVSTDATRFLRADAATLQSALEDWDAQSEALGRRAVELEQGAGEPLDPDSLHAPLPRAYQYCEGSTYLSHMERCRAARNAELPPGHGVDPAVLQSCSDRFLAPHEAIELADEQWGLDLEATVAVIVGDVPMGVSADEAPGYVRLVTLVNDLTLRNVLPVEFAKGIGFFQAKPLRPFAPIAVMPEGLGSAWDGRLLHATVKCWVNGELLGSLDSGADAAFDFGQVLAHAARTRPLSAGTIVGTGTISNRDERRGFGCLAEKRAIEIRDGRPVSPLLQVGDTVAIEAFDADDRSIFGAMRSTVVQPNGGPG